MMIPTLLIIAFASFSLMRLVPGDVILAQISGQAGGAQGGTAIDPETVRRLRHELGLEGTVVEQFARWLGGVVRGDFGDSYLTQRPTLDEFRARLPVTVELGLIALALSTVTGVFVGVTSALYQDRVPDYVARVMAILALSVPNFFLGVIVVIVLSRLFGYSSPTGVNSLFTNPVTNLKQFALPAFVLAGASAGIVARLARTSLLEVLRQDYIRTAFAKGLRQRHVVVGHALKNALIPVVTLVGGQLVVIVGGSVVVEQIFNLRGVGQLTLTSLFQRDYVQLQTNVFLFSLAIVVANLAVDVAYGWLDPRIRYD